jgi:hypothetical protein
MFPAGGRGEAKSLISLMSIFSFAKNVGAGYTSFFTDFRVAP